ncbi:MAG: T9SS type A sorting domain-containing protein [Crocinitomicaceae bacterium]
MKKQFTLLSILGLTAGVAFGQVNSFQLPTSKLAPKNISVVTKAVSTGNSTQKAGGDLVWGDNFSGAATWNIGGNGAQGAWVLCTGPADAQVSNATSYMGAMASPTAANGFAGFDGTQYLLTPPVLAQNAWIESPIIDFTGLTAVNINFQERYRPFNHDVTYVEVSTDGGATWGVSTAINSNLVRNGNPYQGLYSLTVAVGGSSQGMIRFRWESLTADNQYGSGYGWFIDDVTITEAYNNNLTLQYSYNVVGAQALHYSMFPKTQVAPTAVVSFGTVVKNNGLNSQNALLNVAEATTPYSGVSATPVTLAFGQKDTVDISSANGFIIPSTVGVYKFGYDITSNNNTLELTDDDTSSMKIQVTADIMAVDKFNGNANSITGQFTGWQGGTGDAGIGTYYEIFQAASFDNVKVGIYNTAVANQNTYLNQLNVSIYKYDGTQFNAYAVSQDVQIAAADFGNLVNVPFSTPVNVVAGDLLMVVAGFYDGAPVPIAFAGTIPKGQTVGVNGAAITGLASDDSLVVDAPVVRIQFGSHVGIQENVAPTFAVYSVENGLNVDLSSTELKGATIQVVSMDGKVVAKQALTTNQMNTIKVNVPTGIYFYAISNDSNSYQGKVFIK